MQKLLGECLIFGTKVCGRGMEARDVVPGVDSDINMVDARAGICLLRIQTGCCLDLAIHWKGGFVLTTTFGGGGGGGGIKMAGKAYTQVGYHTRSFSEVNRYVLKMC